MPVRACPRRPIHPISQSARSPAALRLRRQTAWDAGRSCASRTTKGTWDCPCKSDHRLASGKKTLDTPNAPTAGRTRPRSTATPGLRRRGPGAPPKAATQSSGTVRSWRQDAGEPSGSCALVSRTSPPPDDDARRRRAQRQTTPAGTCFTGEWNARRGAVDQGPNRALCFTETPISLSA
jgi:hypothetical protein